MAYLTTYQVCEIARDTYVINEAGMAAMFLVHRRRTGAFDRYWSGHDRSAGIDTFIDTSSL